jgi:hypothetical protein
VTNPDNTAPDGGAGLDELSDDLKLEIYRTALETRNFEIKLFWQRSNYFLVLNTAIAVGFFSRDERDGYTFLLSVVGVVAACLWVGVTLGSKYWQVRWEQRLEDIEDALPGNWELFFADEKRREKDVRKGLDYENSENGWLIRRYNDWVLKKPSVSKLMTLLSVFFALLWAVLAGITAVCAFM